MAATGVDVKMGVSGVTQFKAGMKESQAAVKNLSQQLKLNEQQLKLNGDAENYLQTKSQLLEEQIRKQQDVVRNAEQALKSMKDKGVKETSVEFQRMQQASYASQTELLRMRTELQNVGQSAENAETGVGNMNEQLEDIGHGISWQNVTSGIDSITEKLEAAAKKALRLGKAIVSATLGGGQWADDLATEAEKWGMTPEQLYRMQQTANLIDTDADTILNARQKLTTAMGKQDDKETMGAFAALGINYLKGDSDNVERVFWKAGEALMKWGNEVEQNEYAMKLYGKSWHDLVPIFNAGREEYEKTMKSWTWVGDEAFDSLTGLNDEQAKFSSEFETIKRQFEGTMAEVMTPIMETLTELMKEFNTYLQSDEGQEMLASLGETISALFEDLKKIDPEKVISGIKDAIEGVKGALDWIKTNKDTIITAIEGIALAFAGMKIAGLALHLGQLVSGFKDLLGKNAAENAAGSAASAAASGLAGSLEGGIAAKMAGFLTSKTGILSAAALLGYPMADKILNGDMRTPDEIGRDTAAILGGQGIVDIYDKIQKQGLSRPTNPDWRPSYQQGTESNYYNPNMAGFERMNEVASEMTGEIGETRQVNADMAAAVTELSGLPAELRSSVEAAVISGMGQVTIIVDDRGMNALSDRVRGGWGNQIMQMVR